MIILRNSEIDEHKWTEINSKLLTIILIHQTKKQLMILNYSCKNNNCHKNDTEQTLQC